jgi:membrane-associated protease RseP (regulator of RpoE activity)
MKTIAGNQTQIVIAIVIACAFGLTTRAAGAATNQESYTLDVTAERPAQAWLGVGAQEAPEALAEQLGLEPGVGLVVTHVSPESPAAGAGLKKNDVLAALSAHPLSHPAQLRRLVQARQPGDEVEVVFYRGGKEQRAHVALGRAPAGFDVFGERIFADRPWPLLRDPFRFDGEAFRDQAKALREALRPHEGEVQRNLEHARKAIEQMVRELEKNKDSMQKEGGLLKELFKSGVRVDDSSTVVVRTKSASARTLVKTDEFGTLIVTGPPDLHLTARDKSGELLFDGRIETPEQRAQVPAEVWKRVAPLLNE